MEIYERKSTVPHTIEEVFAWMERPAAYFRYLSHWQGVETLEKVGTIRDGDYVTFRVRIGPFGIRHVMEHEDYRPPHEFGYRQVVGAQRSWRLRHMFRAAGESRCEIIDLAYCEPSRIVGLLGRERLRRQVEFIFDWTQERIRRDLARHARGPREPLRVLVTGASRLLGTTLAEFLAGGGHDVHRLVRQASGSMPEAEKSLSVWSGDISWNPATGTVDPTALEGFDAVIQLAGEDIGARRWTAGRRKRIWERHATATEFLCGVLARLDHPPAVLVSASPVAIHFHGEVPSDDSSLADQGFLAEVANAWSQATEAAREVGIRVVHVRLGEVLNPAAGLLKRLLPAFRFGAGGVAGNGKQPINWIGLEDAVAALYFLMYTDAARGLIDVVAPTPSTNREFARTLAEVLRRPAFLPVPGFVIRAMYGEMGDQLILGGKAAVPERLDDLGFHWDEPTLEGALRWELGRA